MSLWLSSMGAQVCGYSLAPVTSPSMYQRCRVFEDIVSHFADIRDAEKLSSAINEFQPDIVFHLAAQALVLPSYADPVETYGTNVMGTLNLLEAVRKSSGARAVVVVTSDKCYENQERVAPYVETDPMGGYDPYSSSKGCAEILTKAYTQSYFNSAEHDQHRVAIASARAGNVVGGGDWSENRLVPDLVQSLCKNAVVDIRRPNAIRPWQHVLEPLGGYIKLAEKLVEDGKDFIGGWNFGPGDEDTITVGEIAKMFLDIWGSGELNMAKQPPVLHEATLLRLDSTKSRERLGCFPVWNVRKTMIETANWYKANMVNVDMKEFTLAQITKYQEDAEQD